MIENGYIIKDINPDLAYDQRKSGIYIDMESMLPYGLVKLNCCDNGHGLNGWCENIANIRTLGDSYFLVQKMAN